MKLTALFTSICILCPSNIVDHTVVSYHIWPQPLIVEALPGTLEDTLLSVGEELDRSLTCLAQAVYFEARSEPLEGQLAVAQVVLNRVKSSRYPNTICDVVFQNDHRRHKCQFSFACDGLTDTPYESRAWTQASKVAVVAHSGLWEDITDKATHYHATYVSPRWSRTMISTAQYGEHKFYKIR